MSMSALLQSFRDYAPAAVSRSERELTPAREEALRSLLAAGLPGPRSEAWRYTNLRALERRRFVPVEHAPAIDARPLADIPAPRLVFVNGRFAAAHSSLDGLPAGVELLPLSQALQGDDSRAVSFLGRRFNRDDEPFARANAALAREGMVLRVAEAVVVEPVVHLVHIGAAVDGVDQQWHLRCLIELHEGARLHLAEHWLGQGTHAHLATVVSHVHLKPGARLAQLRVQQEAAGASLFARTDAVLGRDAEYRRLDLELGAGLARHELNVDLHGRGAQVQANGLLLADGRRALDTRLGIDHALPGTRCELTWRGLARDAARAAFHGGILIRAGADGSEARLSNKNLLLSEGAEIASQPVLEIHADEVKAAHGSTVGRLDPNALFYLRSRGLTPGEAERLLVRAFCFELLDCLGDGALRSQAEQRLNDGLVL